MLVTRPLVDRSMRQVLQRNPNVTFRWGKTAKSFMFSEDAKSVIGVRLNDSTELTGSLVVDAMGRNSNGGRWLSDAGYPSPRKMEVNTSTFSGTSFIVD